MRAKLFSILLLSLAALTSCNEKEDPKPSTGGGNVIHTNFYATISNRAWDASSAAVSFVGKRMKIAGTPENLTLLEIDLSDSVPGTYVIDGTQTNKVTFSTDSSTFDSKVTDAYKGKVIITKVDKVNGVVIGTFSLTLRNTVTGFLTSVEDGVINKVPFGELPSIFTGDTLFLSYIKVPGKTGIYYTLRNPVSNEIGYKKIISPYNFEPGDNVDFNKTSGAYVMFPGTGTGGIFNVKNGSQSISFGVQSASAPVQVGGVYYRHEYNFVKGLVSFSSSTGASNPTPIVPDSVNSVVRQTTDGTFIYKLCSDSLHKIEPGSRTRTIYPIATTAPFYFSIDYAGSNGLLAVKQAVVGGIVKTYLVKLNVGSFTVTETILRDLNLNNVNLNAMSASYNSRTNTFFVAAYDQTSKTTFAEVNLNTQVVKNYDLPGMFRGVETLY